MASFGDPWAGAKSALLAQLSAKLLPGAKAGAGAAVVPAVVTNPGSFGATTTQSGVNTQAVGSGASSVSAPAASSGGGGVSSVWGNPSSQDSVDAWFAKAVLKAQSDPAYMQHLLSSVTGPNGPTGSLLTHYLNMIKGVMAGDPTWIKEATYYAGNPSYNGWNNAAGDGIAGDGM
jgi:hypothetical protein